MIMDDKNELLITFHTLSEFKNGALTCVMGPFHTATKFSKLLGAEFIGIARVNIEKDHFLKFTCMEKDRGVDRLVGDPLVIIYDKFSVFIVDKVLHINLIYAIYDDFDFNRLKVPESLKEAYNIYTKGKSEQDLYNELKYFDTRVKEYVQAYMTKLKEDYNNYKKVK